MVMSFSFLLNVIKNKFLICILYAESLTKLLNSPIVTICQRESLVQKPTLILIFRQRVNIFELKRDVPKCQSEFTWKV